MAVMSTVDGHARAGLGETSTGATDREGERKEGRRSLGERGPEGGVPLGATYTYVRTGSETRMEEDAERYATLRRSTSSYKHFLLVPE